MQRDGDHIKTGSCDLPVSSLDAVVVNLRNLGGHAGTSFREITIYYPTTYIKRD